MSRQRPWRHETPEILYEDNHVLALHKPYGLAVQPGTGHDFTVTQWVGDWLKKRDGKPGQVYARPAHRLDKATSGVLLFAKTGKAASRLQQQWVEGTVQKTYLAVVENPKQGVRAPLENLRGTVVSHYLSRDSTPKVQVRCTEAPNFLPAQLRIEEVWTLGQWSLVQVELLTGRKHQIRAQLAFLGFPVVGDRRYGASEGISGNFSSIALLSWKLRWNHPTKPDIRLEATSNRLFGPFVDFQRKGLFPR